MINSLFSFFVFGFLSAFYLCVNLFVQRVVGSKVFIYLTDFCFPLVLSLVYYCLLLSYNNGCFRYYYLIAIIVGALLYRFSFHILFKKQVNRLAVKLCKYRKEFTNLYKCKKFKK